MHECFSSEIKKSVREMFGYTCKLSTFEIVTFKALVLKELCMMIDWKCIVNDAWVFSKWNEEKSVRKMFGYTCKFSTFEIVNFKTLVLKEPCMMIDLKCIFNDAWVFSRWNKKNLSEKCLNLKQTINIWLHTILKNLRNTLHISMLICCTRGLWLYL